jgi:hypothetical protein
MPSKAQERFNNDYLWVRRELLRPNSNITAITLKQWLQERTDKLVNEMTKERWNKVRKGVQGHAERELEMYHAGLRYHGEEDNDE